MEREVSAKNETRGKKKDEQGGKLYLVFFTEAEMGLTAPKSGLDQPGNPTPPPPPPLPPHHH